MNPRVVPGLRALVVLAALVGILTAFSIGTTSAPASAVTKLSDADARARVTAAGIRVTSSGGCTDRNNPHCTSLDQVNLATVQGVITLKQASGCAVTITGGTETGHASGTYSHWNGYKLDLAHNSCLDSYVHNAFTYVGLRGDGYPQWKSAAGNLYCDEGSHWDVTFYTCGGCARAASAALAAAGGS